MEYRQKYDAALGISNLVAPYLAAIMPAIDPRIKIYLMQRPGRLRRKESFQGWELLGISDTELIHRLEVQCCPKLLLYASLQID